MLTRQSRPEFDEKHDDEQQENDDRSQDERGRDCELRVFAGLTRSGPTLHAEVVIATIAEDPCVTSRTLSGELRICGAANNPELHIIIAAVHLHLFVHIGCDGQRTTGSATPRHLCMNVASLNSRLLARHTSEALVAMGVSRTVLAGCANANARLKLCNSTIEFFLIEPVVKAYTQLSLCIIVIIATLTTISDRTGDRVGPITHNTILTLYTIGGEACWTAAAANGFTVAHSFPLGAC